MKKINLFNKTISPLSDGKGCPVERGGVWACWRNAPRITPSPFGATPSWKEGERSGRGGLWFAALVSLFIATPSFAEPTELDKKTVASKAYVDTKQDKITTGNIMLYDDPDGTEGDISVPGLVAYDPQTSTLSGNKIGILDQDTILDHEGTLFTYGTQGGYGSEMDNFVPTVRAVVESLRILDDAKQNNLPAVWTDPTDAYYTASTGGQTIDLTATPGRVGHRYITAGGSQPLTQKAGADNVILYINGTKTLAEYQTSNFGATGDFATTNQNYINGALVSLELLKDVYSALHNEIQNATPTGTPGNVAMYDPSTGALGDGVATYSGATAQDPYNATNDAAKIATAAAVETKQTKRVCAGYEPGHENDPDYCWLWDFPD